MRSGQLTVRYILICSLFLLLTPVFTSAQDTWLHVQDIRISGNHHTKDFIVLREMQIKKGDSIKTSDLKSQLETARQHLYNTVMFVSVDVGSEKLDATGIVINIILKERWYIFPIPNISLVDRTFNEWWVKHHADLNRLNYGIDFFHYNLRGRRDPLKIYVAGGYTRTIAFSYIHLYSNSSLTRGFTTGGGYTKVREVGYQTSNNNELKFYKKDDFVSRSWNARIGYIIRNGLRKKEMITLGYSWNKVSDSVIILNPNYFNLPVTGKGSLKLSYQLQYFHVDNIIYPLAGYIYGVNISKEGIKLKGGLNSFSIGGEYKKYVSGGRKWFFSLELQGECKLPFQQAFLNQKSFGYGTYVRGLEYYVIDGVASVLAMINVKKELIHFNIPTFIRSKTYDKLPFRIYGKAYSDIGYAYLKRSPARLNNRVLFGRGFGVDIVTLYDLHLRVEYSFNQLGQNGLFLHNQSGL